MTDTRELAERVARAHSITLNPCGEQWLLRQSERDLIVSALRSQPTNAGGGRGNKIIEGLKDAAAGNFARVTIEGQTWKRDYAGEPAPSQCWQSYEIEKQIEVADAAGPTMRDETDGTLRTYYAGYNLTEVAKHLARAFGYALPAPVSSPQVMEQEIARIIDPVTMKKYHDELASGRKAANGQLWADVMWGRDREIALAKSRAVLSLIQSRR